MQESYDNHQHNKKHQYAVAPVDADIQKSLHVDQQRNAKAYDVIIIGSGPAGVHAALPLVEAGKNVVMIDGGLDAPATTSIEDRNFEDVRRLDSDQSKLFLGEDLSSIPIAGLTGGLGGGMTSGNRGYVVDKAEALLPLHVKNGYVIQSLAKGGLGAAWGATCAYLDAMSLSAMGLPPKDMQRSYDEITRVIGISGPHTRAGVQPPLPPDHHASAMLDRAARRHRQLETLDVTVGQPHAAVLTQDLFARKATHMTDMEYYTDPGRAVYRPQYTVDHLKSFSNFRYLPGNVVRRIEEYDSETVVYGHAIDDAAQPHRWTCRTVIVAAGAINTARILLQSFNLFDVPLPFVTKPHLYVPCLHPSTFGKKGPRERSSLCQLLLTDETKGNDVLPSGCAQLYSYRSLLLFRLIRSLPLPTPEALGLAALLSPSLVIADIRFPGRRTDGRTLMLRRHDNTIEITGRTAALTDTERASLQRLRAAMKLLGLWPLRAVANLPDGSTSHHAGTIPISDDPTLPLSASPDGKLHQGKRIYIADAALFRCLSPLPHTLTIMANARRIGTMVATR